MTLSRVAACGSVTGGEHRRLERDGQDGAAVVRTAHVTAAIVTDGCSSGRQAEVGARLAATWLAALVEDCFRKVKTEAEAERAAQRVTHALFRRLRVLARSLGGARTCPAKIEELLLFTFLVAAVTDDVAIVFGVGDGTTIVGRQHTVIDPGPRNAPPYLAYGLFDGGAPPAARIHFVGPARETVAVATDGIEGLSSAEIDAIVFDVRYAKNPSLLRKRLVVHARDGRFHDDATLGVVQVHSTGGTS